MFYKFCNMSGHRFPQLAAKSPRETQAPIVEPIRSERWKYEINTNTYSTVLLPCLWISLSDRSPRWVTNLIRTRLMLLQRVIDSPAVKSGCSHQSTVRFQVHFTQGFVAMDTAAMKVKRLHESNLTSGAGFELT